MISINNTDFIALPIVEIRKLREYVYVGNRVHEPFEIEISPTCIYVGIVLRFEYKYALVYSNGRIIIKISQSCTFLYSSKTTRKYRIYGCKCNFRLLAECIFINI